MIFFKFFIEISLISYAEWLLFHHETRVLQNCNSKVLQWLCTSHLGPEFFQEIAKPSTVRVHMSFWRRSKNKTNVIKWIHTWDLQRENMGWWTQLYRKEINLTRYGYMQNKIYFKSKRRNLITVTTDYWPLIASNRQRLL